MMTAAAQIHPGRAKEAALRIRCSACLLTSWCGTVDCTPCSTFRADLPHAGCAMTERLGLTIAKKDCSLLGHTGACSGNYWLASNRLPAYGDWGGKRLRTSTIAGEISVW
jgi:hypothetical protein